MAWTFPTSRISAGYVLDLEDFNGSVAAFAAETDGNLNEQNWGLLTLASAMTADPLQVADDIAIRLMDLKEEVDPHAATAAMFTVPQMTRWTVVPDTEIEFVSPGGKILVIIDFQIHCPIVVDESCGTNFCIELDGSPQMNSLAGTGDQANDYIDTGLSVSSFAVDFNYGTSPAFRNMQKKLQVKGTYRIAPGLHTVRLLVRNLVALNAVPSQFISQRETIILHLWA